LDYPKTLLKNLYRTMLQIRLVEESFIEPILSGEVRTPCHLYTGEEAVAAGLCAALEKRDSVFGNHRSHGHFLAKGGSMNELVAEVYCRETGCSRGRGGSMHLIDPSVGMMGAAPIVAGTISLAVGAALASQIRRDKRVAVSFFGDGATGEGVLYEALNFASLRKLPIIFACENNFYSTHMPIRDCRVENSIYKIADPFCIESRAVDGNDVLQVYEASRQAVERCRAGEGPVFLEFMTYRMRGHVGPNDNIQGAHTDIRPPEEVERWRGRDPILRFEEFLSSRDAFSTKTLGRIRRDVLREVEAAHAFARKSPPPGEKELLNYVFK
jgi:acetoin:2,6-dichlorophenolindophenol oxidoreductase subunit alpha